MLPSGVPQSTSFGEGPGEPDPIRNQAELMSSDEDPVSAGTQLVKSAPPIIIAMIASTLLTSDRTAVTTAVVTIVIGVVLYVLWSWMVNCHRTRG